jgi:hypothetical protein
MKNEGILQHRRLNLPGEILHLGIGDQLCFAEKQIFVELPKTRFF